MMTTHEYVVERKSDGRFLKGSGCVGGWCVHVNDAKVFESTRTAQNTANVRTPRGYSRFFLSVGGFARFACII